MRRGIAARKALAFACFFAATLLCLTGCGGRGAAGDGETGQAEEEEAAKEPEEPGSSDDVLMVVGEETVSYEEAFAYIYMLKQQYEPEMGDGIWDFEVEDGVTFEDYAKDQVIEELTQLKILCQQADVLGVALDEDEERKAEVMAAQLVESADGEDREAYGLTEERMASIFEENLLAEKVYEISTNEVDTTISDEEAKQVAVQYLMVMTKGTDKNGNEVDMSKEEKRQAKKKAKALYKEARDLDASFYSFADANTDASKVELVFGKDDMPEDFGEEAMALRTGEMSGLISGESGYYIVYCVSDFDEDATARKKEQIIEEGQDEVFRRKYKEWSQDYERIVSTALWDEIEF